MTHTVDVPITWAEEVFAGEDKSITITIEDSLDQIVNVSSWTFLWQLRLTRSTPTTILSKATGTGVSFVTDGSDGKVKIAFTKDETKVLKAGIYYHGLARTNTSAWDVVAEGPFTLRKAAVHAS